MYDKNDITKLCDVTAEDLNSAVNHLKPNNNLSDLGDTFLNTQKTYKINALVLLAIACLESSFGNSVLAKERNNLFGIKANDEYKGTSKYGNYFSSREDSVDQAGFKLRHQYIELDHKASWCYTKGDKSLRTIGSVWSSNPDWYKLVISLCERLKNSIKGKKANSMEVIKKLTTNNCYKDRNHPKFIVIHETDNTSKGADALKHAQALGNGNLKTSVHYFVDDKCVVQSLEHKHGAWAVGKTYGTPLVPGVTNLNTINIEICVNRDGNYNKARQNCIAFTKQLMKQTSIPASRVIRHYDAKKKTCPRHMVENQALWTDFKKQLTSATPTPAKARIGTGLVYANDIDRVSAEALQLEIRDATLIPLSALNKYKVQHLIAIGAAGNSLKGEAETILQGADRVDTLFKVTDYIKEKRSK